MAIADSRVAALPRTSGVYIFKGEGTLPLYIGKSVDIRSRVMSHLRAPDEASMVAPATNQNAVRHSRESNSSRGRTRDR
jgi:excinuclease UvrABC nuclease subunit